MAQKLPKDVNGNYIFPDICDLLPEGSFQSFRKWLQEKATIYHHNIQAEKKFSLSKAEMGGKLDDFLTSSDKVQKYLSDCYSLSDNILQYFYAAGGDEFEEIRVRLTSDLTKLLQMKDEVKRWHAKSCAQKGAPNKLARDIDLYLVYKNLLFTGITDRDAALNANEILKRFGYHVHYADYRKDLFDNIKRSIKKAESYFKKFSFNSVLNDKFLAIRKNITI